MTTPNQIEILKDLFGLEKPKDTLKIDKTDNLAQKKQEKNQTNKKIVLNNDNGVNQDSKYLNVPCEQDGH